MNCGTQEKLTPKLKKKWVAADQCDRMELLTLRLPTPMSDLKNSVSRPTQRPVKNSYPTWQARELNEKIPLYQGSGPTGPLVLHRGLVGNNPLKSNVKLKFSLKDPYCQEVSNSYNPLHDPHLINWVNSPTNCKFLQKQGLITEDMDVVCNLKEYNEYRRFLWRIHNDRVIQKLKQKEQLELEEKLIFNANRYHTREIGKQLKRIKYIISKNKRQHVSNRYLS